MANVPVTVKPMFPKVSAIESEIEAFLVLSSGAIQDKKPVFKHPLLINCHVETSLDLQLISILFSCGFTSSIIHVIGIVLPARYLSEAVGSMNSIIGATVSKLINGLSPQVVDKSKVMLHAKSIIIISFFIQYSQLINSSDHLQDHELESRPYGQIQ